MCGRLNITDDPYVLALCDLLGINVYPKPNSDLRPTQTVLTAVEREGKVMPLETVWGIKPSWAKKLLINAQAETVAEKKTFKKAFEERRCVIPCAGWYEWRDDGGPGKQKYSFTYGGDGAFLMAGIWYEGDHIAQLVTLTTEPTEQCAEIHSRMPLLVDPEAAVRWLGAESDTLGDLLSTPTHIPIKISKSK